MLPDEDVWFWDFGVESDLLVSHLQVSQALTGQTAICL